MGTRGPVWGEGFVDDGWQQASRVGRWDLVHPDELLRLFPALVGTGHQSALLIGRLEEAIAVRWRRTRASHVGRRLEGVDANALTTPADVLEAAWFPSRGLLRSTIERLLGTGKGIEAPTVGEEAAVVALDDLLMVLRTGRVTPYAEHRALTLAFYAGIHPASLWPEALPLHECATAIGWLGVVARGRDALLPPDIASTLADSVTEVTERPRDQRFAVCGFTASQWSFLGRAARQCLQGRRDIVRLNHARRTGRHVPALSAGAVHRLVLDAVTSTRANHRAS